MTVQVGTELIRLLGLCDLVVLAGWFSRHMVADLN